MQLAIDVPIGNCRAARLTHFPCSQLGAMMSATDPVATIAVLNEVRPLVRRPPARSAEII